MRIGCMLPTHNSPLFYRLSLLQMLAQTRRPNVIAVVVNGKEDYTDASYDVEHELIKEDVWVIKEVLPNAKAPAFYTEALSILLKADCDVFFKLDHDDFYSARHIEKSLENLRGHDYALQRVADVWVLPYRGKPVYSSKQRFDCNPTGCPANTLCFNRSFAEAYYEELKKAGSSGIPDDIILTVLMSRFKGFIDEINATTAYIIHGTNTSTAHLAEEERIRQGK